VCVFFQNVSKNIINFSFHLFKNKNIVIFYKISQKTYKIELQIIVYNVGTNEKSKTYILRR